MGDLRETFERSAADALRGGIGNDEVRELRLDLAEFIE